MNASIHISSGKPCLKWNVMAVCHRPARCCTPSGALVCPSMGAGAIVALLELLDARLQGVVWSCARQRDPESQAGRCWGPASHISRGGGAPAHHHLCPQPSACPTHLNVCFQLWDLPLVLLQGCTDRQAALATQAALGMQQQPYHVRLQCTLCWVEHRPATAPS